MKKEPNNIVIAIITILIFLLYLTPFLTSAFEKLCSL